MQELQQQLTNTKQQEQQAENQIAALTVVRHQAAGAAKMLEHLMALAMQAETKSSQKTCEMDDQVERMAGLPDSCHNGVPVTD